jgi:hypothetical protein
MQVVAKSAERRYRIGRRGHEEAEREHPSATQDSSPPNEFRHHFEPHIVKPVNPMQCWGSVEGLASGEPNGAKVSRSIEWRQRWSNW